MLYEDTRECVRIGEEVRVRVCTNTRWHDKAAAVLWGCGWRGVDRSVVRVWCTDAKN